MVGAANLKQPQKEFAQLTAQVATLNSQLATMIDNSKAVDAAGFNRLAKAAAYNSKQFREGAASTGMFDVEQRSLNSATDEYIKKLKQQKLGFRELMRQRKIATAAYREQLAMESMLVKRAPSSTLHNKEVFDVITPKRYAAELDTAGRRLSMLNQQLKSGATQMVNWGKNTQWAGRQLMVGFTMPIAAFGAAAGIMAYQVDAAMTRVRKVYDTTADQTTGNTSDLAAVNKELADLTTTGLKTAMEAAKAYGAVGTDTMEVMGNLAATGLNGGRLQEATKEVMRIAALGEVDTGVATDATIALQSVFRDTINTSEELADAFNYMNAVENATSLTTADFAQAIPVAAGAVKAWGGDIKELGILLTAMRENGINASEGANALKATMQRLARPSKQVREEWEAITGTNILNITENADSLTDVFTQIFHATEALSDADKRKAFAGLFGSYQVGKMMALTKGMGELEQGVGQVSAAYQLAGQDSATWAKIAENETAQAAASISGQFKRAFETLKLELADMGKPFVQAATTALGAISNILSAFNGLPSLGKKVIAFGVLLAALAGPVVMLTGLMGNLLGNGLKTFAGMLTVINKFGTSMQILDKDNRIALKSQDLMEKGYVSQTKAVQNLTLELQKLTAAQAAANKSTAAMASAGATAGVTKSKALIAREAREAEHARLVGHMNQNYGILGTTGNITYHADDAKSARNKSGRISGYEAERRTRADIARIDQQILATSQQTTKETAKTRRNLTGAAVAGGALAAGMVLTMTNSNETANEIGNMLIMGSLVVPAAWQLVKALGAGLKYLKISYIIEKAILAVEKAKILAQTVYYRSSIALSKAQLAYNAAGTAGVGIMGRLGAGVAAVTNPIGLAVTAVAAVGVGLWAWKKHLDKIEEEQTKLHHNINTMADAWAEKMGLVRKEYEKIAHVQRGIQETDKYQTYLDAYNSGDMESRRDAFANKDISAEQRVNMARAQFATLIRDYGLSFSDASLSLQAMYESAGLSLYDAENVIDSLRAEFGAIDGADAMEIQAKVMFDPNQTEDAAHESATDYGRSFAQALADADTGAESQALIDSFTKTLNVAWDTALSQMDDGLLGDKFAQMGIDTGDELRKAVEEAGSVESLVQTLFPDETSQNQEMMVDMLNNAVIPAITRTKSAMGGLTGPNSPFSDLPSNIDNLTQLGHSLDGIIVEAKGIDDTKLKQLLGVIADPAKRTSPMVQSMLPGMTQLEKIVYSVTDANKMQVANALLLAGGYQQINSEAELLDFLAGKLPAKLDQATGAARGLAMALDSAQAVDIFRQGAEAAQSAAGEDYSSAYNDMLDGQLQQEQDTWDKRIDAAGNAGERAKDALNNAWENKIDAAEKYWDHRIELVDKAIEAEEKAEEKREKMFDAEVARIQKLNDMANANVDFNVALNEGRLDEAAKLRNDMEAQTSVEAIDRARNQMSGQSEKRVDRLGNKKDRLEKQRDKALDAMHKLEEQQKAHLDRMTSANQAALEKQRDAAIKAKEQEIAIKKDQMEKELEMAMAGSAKSGAELRKRFEDAGLDYKWFYRTVIKPEGDTWGSYFGKAMHEKMRVAFEEIRTDSMWETMGKDTVAQIARGMGFSGEKAMMYFLKTGEMKDFHENTPAKPGSANANDTGDQYGNKPGFHTGGMVGSDRGGRKGVAKTYRGQHPSEMMINAQKGEFIVNRSASKKNEGLLRAINDGTDGVGGMSTGGPPAKAGQGLYSFFGAAFGRAMAMRTGDALQKAVVDKRAALAAMASSFASGNPSFGTMGHYSLPGVLPWVLEAANYLGGKFGVGTIGGVGERASNPTSDHPKGLALDFMVGSDVAKGNAIAEEALRLRGVLDATYMIWQARINSFDDRGWMPYTHPSGATDPTSMHMDHVHLSFSPSGHAGDLPKLVSSAAGGGNPNGGGYVPGSGGRHRPTTSSAINQGIHPVNAIDIGSPVGSPLYAIADGKVTGSYDIPGYEPRRMIGGVTGPSIQDGMRSYGRVITIDHGGFGSLSAHLSSRGVSTGQTVRGGSIIGRTGNAGNVQSSYGNGAHLHFGVSGGNPYDFVSLRKGAMDVKYDNTLANLHKGEGVLTRDINSQIKTGAELFANGGGMGDTYNVYPSEGMDEDRFARKLFSMAERKRRRRPIVRTVK